MDAEQASTAVVEQAKPAHKPKYTKLTRSDIGVLLKLHRDGLTQVEIAKRLGCHQTAVSDWLASLKDTTDVAKEYLRGSSLRMAQNIVRKGLPRDHVAALKGLNVLEEHAQSGLVIQVGGNGNDIKIALLSPGTPKVESESR